MFLIAVRKMLSNKWMLICTLLGSIISVAMLSSIPTYTDGIMQRMLSKDLENSQQASGKYPGGYLIEYDRTQTVSGSDNTKSAALGNKITGVIGKSVDLPLIAWCNYVSVPPEIVILEDTNKNTVATLSSMSDFQEHIKITQGRMYQNQKVSGAYEAIVPEEAIRVLGLTLGNTYRITSDSFDTGNGKDANLYTKVTIVGVFTYKDTNDPYWFKGIETYNKNIFLDMNLLRTSFLSDEKTSVYKEKWFFAYDYHKISIDNISSILSAYDTHVKWFKKDSDLSYDFAPYQIINEYFTRAKLLKTTLLVLQLPVLVILAFYAFMISKLKVDFESNEIAVMKSRGASSMKVFAIYAIESLLIGATAMIIGPVLGLYICKLLGSSNGFLELVQRSALPLSLDSKSYLYAMAAVLFVSVSMMLPAYAASRTSIVLYKQRNLKGRRSSFWKKFYIDIILLGIAFWGLYSYHRNQKVLFLSGARGSDLGIDPLLFVVSVLFIFGAGLLVLRVFPYAVRLIFWVGRKIWNPVFYASFVQVGRNSGQEQFTMIFIILTLSIGIFSANSARTINRNMEEKVYYQTGSDIVVKGVWTSNKAPGISNAFTQVAAVTGEDVVYEEPPFTPFTKLKGAESVTKVMSEDGASALLGNELIPDVHLMGIIPDQFGKTAWFRPDLLPYHWYQYLNLMSDSQQAVLVSTAFREKLKAQEGDSISIRWGDERSIQGTIYGFVDYWPTLNPNKKVEEKAAPYFVVANLDYIQAFNSVDPYQVWIKKKAETTSNEIYEQLSEMKVDMEFRADAAETIIAHKNDPMLQGTNGSLTLSFIVIIAISILGFLIYWILSIKQRVLQFGIFRAIGLTSGSIIGMITCEQVLITGTSVLAGIGIGSLTSNIFVPMLQLVYSAEEQVPPFKVIAYAGDYIRLYVIVGIMLIACFIALWRIISKINVGQALKLGED